MIKKAVVLLSGGIDSSTAAAIAKAEGYEIYALSFDYSQRHSIELESAKRVAESLGVSRHLIMKFDMREIGGSALTSDIEVPKSLSYGDSPDSTTPFNSPLTKGETGGCVCKSGTDPCEIQNSKFKIKDSSLVTRYSSPIPVTYVPARNTIFLSFALSWAEVLEAPDIFIGANAVDYSGYPDCRPEYLKAFEDMANISTKVSVEGKVRFKIKAPLLHMTKADIIKKGTELGLDYSLTWSCYDPQSSVRGQASRAGRKEETSALDAHRLTPDALVPCGRCDSCLFRAKGFREAGIKDPLARRHK